MLRLQIMGVTKEGRIWGSSCAQGRGGGEIEALYIKITKDLHSVQQQQTSEEGHAE